VTRHLLNLVTALSLLLFARRTAKGAAGRASLFMAGTAVMAR
jgi:hypothetical protein